MRSISPTSASVSAFSRPVSSTKTPIGRRALAMAWVSTMSSADRLLASTAGEYCCATERSMLLSTLASAAPEQRRRLRHRRLVVLAEVAEGGQRVFDVLAVAQQERVEAALLHVVQVVARHLADGSQLALVAVAL